MLNVKSKVSPLLIDDEDGRISKVTDSGMNANSWSIVAPRYRHNVSKVSYCTPAPVLLTKAVNVVLDIPVSAATFDTLIPR